MDREDDSKWPPKNKDGRQELEIRLGNEHISFEVGAHNLLKAPITDGLLQTAKIGSLVDVQESDDPEGLRVFHYLVQDLKALVFSLISLHFKVDDFFDYWNAQLTCNTDQANINGLLFQRLALGICTTGSY